MYECYMGEGLDAEGVTEKRVDARWRDPPMYSVTIDGDGLTLEPVRPRDCGGLCAVLDVAATRSAVQRFAHRAPEVELDLTDALESARP